MYCRVIFLILTVLFYLPTLALASVAGDVNKANELYKQGKFDDALNLYQKALDQDDKSPVVKYDLGTALYKKGEYFKAQEYLEKAAQDKNIKLKGLSEYNLGNVLYRSGIQKENTNVDEAIKSLQGALSHYGLSQANDPKDQDAQANEDFVKKEIERLKQKKAQQKELQRQQKDQKQQKNQKDQQGQQGQQSQQAQQNQQGQQGQQGQQQKEQSSPQDQSGQKDQAKQKAQAQAEKDQQKFDRKLAEDTLEDYQQNEEPKKLLNYMPKKIDDRPVLKDW